MFDFLKRPVETFQEFLILSGRAFRNIFRSPHYADDILLQMDTIGVGSLFIVSLIGFFSGVVMALQMSRALATYGAQGQIGQIVSITLVRELGPVLASLLVAGRNASGIASELGSMRVTEQIDAMRALGTDPIQKLVTPRLIAMAVVLPLLTIIADFLGLVGGYFIAYSLLDITTDQYWSTAWRALEYNDLTQGLLETVSIRYRHRHGGLLLRNEHVRRHARCRPLHHPSSGCRLGVDLHHHLHAGPRCS